MWEQSILAVFFVFFPVKLFFLGVADKAGFQSVCTSQRETQVTYERREKKHISGPQVLFGSGEVVEMDQHWNTDGENFCRVTRTCKNVDFSREELLKKKAKRVESSKT